MKLKYRLVLLIFVLSSMLSACESIELNIEETIKPPTAKNIFVKGTWNIVEYIELSNMQKTIDNMDIKSKKYIGKKAIFDSEVAAVGDDICTEPKYKTISVLTDNYVQNKYRINKENLGLKNKNVKVVTITAKSETFNELIVTVDMKAYIYLENGFLILEKISEDIDEKLKENTVSNAEIKLNNGDYKEDPLLRSSVLIGIRSTNNSYRTIFLYSKNRKIKEVKSNDYLLVPRPKGFWKAGVISIGEGQGNIFAVPFEIMSAPDSYRLKENNIKINFVGNNFIGVEKNYVLKVLPIERLSEARGISVSEIVDNYSFSVFKQAKKDFISTLDSNKAKHIIDEVDETNFTLKRRNGHWIMKSRLYYNQPGSISAGTIDKKYEDFDLNIMVPTKLINYDEMEVPWNEIKSKLPWISDAYMSPNKDIIILVSSDGLYIYPIQNRSIINEQLLKIPLLKSDSIIMTEWSIGKYAEKWSEFIDKDLFDTNADK